MRQFALFFLFLVLAGATAGAQSTDINVKDAPALPRDGIVGYASAIVRDHNHDMKLTSALSKGEIEAWVPSRIYAEPSVNDAFAIPNNEPTGTVKLVVDGANGKIEIESESKDDRVITISTNALTGVTSVALRTHNGDRKIDTDRPDSTITISTNGDSAGIRLITDAGKIKIDIDVKAKAENTSRLSRISSAADGSSILVQNHTNGNATISDNLSLPVLSPGTTGNAIAVVDGGNGTTDIDVKAKAKVPRPLSGDDIATDPLLTMHGNVTIHGELPAKNSLRVTRDSIVTNGSVIVK